MSDLYVWASSQPVWIQVLIALFIFFVAVPVALFALAAVLRPLGAITIEDAIPSVVQPIAITGLVFLAIAGILFASDWISTVLASKFGQNLSLNSRATALLHLVILASLFVGTLVAVVLGTLRHVPSVRATVQKWNNEIRGRGRQDEA